MAIGVVHGGHFPIKFRYCPAKVHCHIRQIGTQMPVFISTNASDVNPFHLRDLYSLCNHSCHRFPRLDSDGRVEPVDIQKLRIALAHSSVLVSVFAKPELISNPSLPSGEFSNSMGIGRDWVSRVMPLNPSNGRLVGFGRSVSDCGLTASIHDVMVLPSLQGRGIGRMIIKNIIRLLTNRGIYDISAICSDRERPFFKACGFGADQLGSTTMMYSRTVSFPANGDQKITYAGRKLLVVPPQRGSFEA